MRVLRVIPADLGRLRVANFVYRRQFENSEGSLRPTRLLDGSRFELEVSEWPQAQAFLLGEYDPPTVNFIAAHLPAGGTFVEAGAHVGLITFQVLQRVQPCSVHAFEPHPRRGEQFQRNATLNEADDRVTLNPLGLSDQNGEVGFDLDRHRVGGSESTSVPVVRLDDYLEERGIEHVDVLKLDIEGHEAQALKGAERALREHRIGAITLEAMEAHGDTAAPRALLEGYGYRRVPLGSGSASPNEAYLAP